MKVSIEMMYWYSADSLPWQLPVPELVAKIGRQLGAVEEWQDLSPRYEGIKIVEITEAKPHPNADKLSIYQIFDGKEYVQVVSGDRTLKVGNKVGWIAPGQTVPSTHGSSNPAVMEARELRGEVSNGMFGSGKELGLNDDHEKVLVLDTDAPAGTLLADAYHLNDAIIDIENKMFTHRPDCFGLLGVAREIAGIQGMPFTSPEWYREDAQIPPAKDARLKLTVQNDIPQLVPRYMAIALDNITIAPSPVWLQSFLHRLGIRPINNVVDITNLYMVVTGQPMHAFDFDKVANGDHATIVVRNPREGEQLPLLDGKTITPHNDAILITNGDKPIGLGGMMGGANSEIDASTTRIVLECATFDMYTIRRTSMAHGIFTDAVTRFSKGQSPAQCAAVLAKAIEDLQHIAHAQVASEVADIYPVPHKAQPIAVSGDFINNRLGSALSSEDMAVMLNNVECHVEQHGDELIITPPFWRTDLEIPEDIVEEIGRLHGYENLPHDLPNRATKAVAIRPIDQLKDKIRDVLSAAGANELQTYTFVPAKLLQHVGQSPELAFAIRNALSPELQHYRLSLTPSLLEKVHPNIKAGFVAHVLYELNKIHIKGDEDCDGMPREYKTLAFVYANKTVQAGSPFYQAKYYLEYLLNSLHIPYKIVPAEQPPQWEIGRQVFAPFESKRSAYLLVGDEGEFCGFIGEYHAKARKNLKLPDYAAGFEIDLERLLKFQQPTAYQPLLKFPATDQDVCLRVAADVQYANIVAVAQESLAADERMRVTITPVDIYQRENDAKHKQVTIRITLQHSERTLTTDETNELLDAIVQKTAKELGAERI